MLFLPVALLVVVGVLAFRALAHRAHPSSRAAGDVPTDAGHVKTQVMPTSLEGTWSLVVALGAMILRAIPTMPHAYTSIPLAVVAAALALVAMIRRHDRAAVLWLPVVFGVGIVVIGVAFWVGG
jgi:hypothetical protein